MNNHAPAAVLSAYICPACLRALRESPAAVAEDYPRWDKDRHEWLRERYDVRAEEELTLFELRSPECGMCLGTTNRHHRAHFSLR